MNLQRSQRIENRKPFLRRFACIDASLYLAVGNWRHAIYRKQRLPTSGLRDDVSGAFLRPQTIDSRRCYTPRRPSKARCLKALLPKEGPLSPRRREGRRASPSPSRRNDRDGYARPPLCDLCRPDGRSAGPRELVVNRISRHLPCRLRAERFERRQPSQEGILLARTRLCMSLFFFDWHFTF